MYSTQNQYNANLTPSPLIAPRRRRPGLAYYGSDGVPPAPHTHYGEGGYEGGVPAYPSAYGAYGYTSDLPSYREARSNALEDEHRYNFRQSLDASRAGDRMASDTYPTLRAQQYDEPTARHLATVAGHGAMDQVMHPPAAPILVMGSSNGNTGAPEARMYAAKVGAYGKIQGNAMMSAPERQEAIKNMPPPPAPTTSLPQAAETQMQGATSQPPLSPLQRIPVNSMYTTATAGSYAGITSSPANQANMLNVLRQQNPGYVDNGYNASGFGQRYQALADQYHFEPSQQVYDQTMAQPAVSPSPAQVGRGGNGFSYISTAPNGDRMMADASGRWVMVDANGRQVGYAHEGGVSPGNIPTVQADQVARRADLQNNADRTLSNLSQNLQYDHGMAAVRSGQPLASVMQNMTGSPAFAAGPQTVPLSPAQAVRAATTAPTQTMGALPAQTAAKTAPKATTSPAISEHDIQETMAQTGMSREQVLAEARKRGML